MTEPYLAGSAESAAWHLMAAGNVQLWASSPVTVADAGASAAATAVDVAVACVQDYDP